MNETLLEILQRPTLWQRSGTPFWDDEHISKGMLAAHLDPLCDAATRKAETVKRCVEWLCSILPATCALIDLGCGPGLYTKPLSDAGYIVTGVDLSRRSLEYARAHDAKTKYICADYLELEYEGAFDAATLIYCDYAALTAPERERLLRRVRRALRPDGLFILDVFTPRHAPEKLPENTWESYPDGGFWSASPHVLLSGAYSYAGGTVFAQRYATVSAKGVEDHIIWDTVYTKESLSDELCAGGFEVLSVFGDACGSPFTDQSDTLCAVTKRR